MTEPMTVWLLMAPITADEGEIGYETLGVYPSLQAAADGAFRVRHGARDWASPLSAVPCPLGGEPDWEHESVVWEYVRYPEPPDPFFRWRTPAETVTVATIWDAEVALAFEESNRLSVLYRKALRNE